MQLWDSERLRPGKQREHETGTADKNHEHTRISEKPWAAGQKSF